MRTPATIFTLALVALAPVGLGALAQQQQQPHPQPAGGASGSSAGAGAAQGAQPDAGAAAMAQGADGGAAGATGGSEPGQSGAQAGAANARTFNIPMTQRGTGAMTHFPIPEQLARNDAPVFVQVRTSAPLDHVSLFYRGHGARRYTELRMNPMGAEQGLPGGYGAQIPCEDTFPPSVEYYAVALDTSGAPVGSAGTEAEPLTLSIVNQRSYPIVPTLPGQNPPRNCGSLVTANPTPRGDAGAGAGGAGSAGAGTSAGGAGAGGGSEPASGSADLGEPCTRNEDCHTGLRCGSTHRCVFPARR